MVTRTLFISFLALFLFTFLKVNAQSKQETKPIYTVFLIGDAGEPLLENDPNLTFLKEKALEVGEKSAVVFLGDNIYPNGMPDMGTVLRGQAEKRLKAQLRIVKDYEGKVVMIPGNHDWNKGRRHGLEHVLNQQRFVENYLGRTEAYYPQDGCPGPVTIELTEGIVMIVVDTQWILHPWEKTKSEAECGVTSSIELFEQLQAELSLHQDKRILVVGHHPLFTFGIHGGRSEFKQHIFPLTDLKKNLFIPLPIVGSIYPLFRKYIGNIQDVSHPRYRVMRKAFLNIFKDSPNLIYAAGHEHNLQYIPVAGIHHIVSGSGSKKTYVNTRKLTEYGASEIGFARLHFFADGRVVLSFFQPLEAGEEETFHKTLYTKPYYSGKTGNKLDEINFSGEYVTVPASKLYGNVGKLKKSILGANYREVWEKEVKVPVFDIGTEKGGLEIKKKGGGFQTKSLGLEAKNGRQYVLRSIDKYPAKAIPEFLRETFAEDIVQDQISAAHPYGAFIVPPLAEAIGIYHTNPKLVYLPDDPRFGKYRSEFANTLALFEERPDDEYWEDYTSFGRSKEIYSTSRTIKKLHKNHHHEVDQRFLLKNRLFDLVIGDWDRHDDQWRWASFEKDKGLIFRPIPRDRDQAFFVNQGFLPRLVSRRWAFPKFEGFDHEVRFVPGFMSNAKWFDRTFLTELKEDEWQLIAGEIQEALNDEVIDGAVKQWPKPIYELSGEEVAEKIKSRRDRLRQYATTYYLDLAKKVDITGSKRRELFEVKRVDEEIMDVSVHKLNEEGEKIGVIYHRVFYTSETDEVRLYGFEGNDIFKVSGSVNKGIKVRIIGGDGDDVIEDDSKVGGIGKKTVVYDTKSGNQLQLGRESKNLTSKDPDVNEYNRLAFTYNRTVPLVLGSINADDGIFIGGGALINTFGFRKDPFKTRHFLTGSFAAATNAFNFRYDAEFIETVWELDLLLNLDIEAPNFTRNFFGLGNESIFNDEEYDIDFYRVRFDNIKLDLGLRKRMGETMSVSIGPRFEGIDVNQSTERFISDPANGLNLNDIFEKRGYAGGFLNFNIDTRDSRVLPTRGVLLDFTGKALFGLNSFSNDYGAISGDYAMYWSLRLPTIVTLANRIGGGKTFGSFDFFQAQTLSGTGKNINLRGYRRTRFYGRSALYNNTSLRIKLFTIRTYLFPAFFGLEGFHDIGRVWVEQENSSEWHRGVGGGFWLAPFRTAVVSFGVGVGEEETLALVNLGFIF